MVRREHPNELRADFQRIYGICIDDVGTTVSVRHAAALAAALPSGSLTMGKVDKKRSLTLGELTLINIYNLLASYVSDSEEMAESLRIDPFGEQEGESDAGCGCTVEEIGEVLSRPRREAQDGN